MVELGAVPFHFLQRNSTSSTEKEHCCRKLSRCSPSARTCSMSMRPKGSSAVCGCESCTGLWAAVQIELYSLYLDFTSQNAQQGSGQVSRTACWESSDLGGTSYHQATRLSNFATAPAEPPRLAVTPWPGRELATKQRSGIREIFRLLLARRHERLG